MDYGEPIYAVADGTITATLDELEPNAPGVLPANDPVLGPKITVETVDGNHIVEDIGGGGWAFYAHLQKDTLLVKPGDKVKKGQVIAKLGNTGNSNASHMHFQLMNGPSVLGSDGVPYVIDRFSYDGQVPVETIFAADDFLERGFPHRRSAQAAAPQAGAAARVGHHRLPDQLRLTHRAHPCGGHRHALHPILDGDAEASGAIARTTRARSAAIGRWRHHRPGWEERQALRSCRAPSRRDNRRWR